MVPWRTIYFKFAICFLIILSLLTVACTTANPTQSLTAELVDIRLTPLADGHTLQSLYFGSGEVLIFGFGTFDTYTPLKVGTTYKIEYRKPTNPRYYAPLILENLEEITTRGKAKDEAR